MFKFFVNGKEVSCEYYSVIKIMKDACSKRICEDCDLENLCAGYGHDEIPSRAEFKIEENNKKLKEIDGSHIPKIKNGKCELCKEKIKYFDNEYEPSLQHGSCKCGFSYTREKK